MAQNLRYPPGDMGATGHGTAGGRAGIGLDRYGRVRNAGRLSHGKRRIAGHSAALAALDT
jgi:hypothetical protein